MTCQRQCRTTAQSPKIFRKLRKKIALTKRPDLLDFRRDWSIIVKISFGRLKKNRQLCIARYAPAASVIFRRRVIIHNIRAYHLTDYD